MAKTKEIAYSSILAALCTLFLTAGAYLQIGEFFWYFIAGICITFTILFANRLCGILCFLSGSILALLFTGFNFIFLIPYLAFFGPYPIVRDFFEKTDINRLLVFLIKCIWFDLSLYIMYRFTPLFLTEIKFINDYIWLIVVVAGSLFFYAYDAMYGVLQKKLKKTADRMVK